MTPSSNFPRTPGEATAGRPRPGASPSVETPGRLPSPRPEARGEFRQIAYAIVGLGALVVLLLSAGIYQSTRSLVVERRREELATRTDRKRQAARDRIHELEKHARFLAGEPNLRGWVVSAQGGLDPAARRRLTTELERAAGSFGFQSVAACAPDGRLIAGTSADAQGESVPSRGQGQALGPGRARGCDGGHRRRGDDRVERTERSPPGGRDPRPTRVRLGSGGTDGRRDPGPGDAQHAGRARGPRPCARGAHLHRALAVAPPVLDRARPARDGTVAPARRA